MLPHPSTLQRPKPHAATLGLSDLLFLQVPIPLTQQQPLSLGLPATLLTCQAQSRFTDAALAIPSGPRMPTWLTPSPPGALPKQLPPTAL